MNNIPPQEPRPAPPAAGPAVPTVPDSPKRIWSKVGAWALILFGLLADKLPVLLPQLQHDFPSVKWGSIASIVGVVWMTVRNVQESGNVKPTNFSPPQ